jgi:succinylglutamate desuccinylase
MDQAVKDVCAVFADRWSELEPDERESFYRDVRLFMKFYTETTPSYRASLWSDLHPQSITV